MAIVQKVDVLIALFSYAGNGGVSAILPEIAMWLVKTCQTMKADPRIGRVNIRRYGDIPLTMERNRVVKDAKDGQFDVIVMIDSDNQPDGYLGRRPWAVPFWESSFDFAFKRLLRGLPSVVACPYCGPPPHPVNGGEENVYVFYCEDDQTGDNRPGYRFTAYSRQHAALMRGIQEIAAGPTGVILYTTNAFDLMPIDRRPVSEILADLLAGTLTPEQAERKLKMQSWFWYEFTDQFQSMKASTEDVTNTREIQMAGLVKHKESVVFCNWDAWALHAKPRYVGMPEPVRMEAVSAVFQEAVLANVSAFDERREVDFTAGLDVPKQSAGSDDPRTGPIEEGMLFPDDPPGDPNFILDDETPVPDLPTQEVIARPTVPIKARMVAGRKVQTVGHETHMQELESLTKVAGMVAKQIGDRPLKMAEIGTWVGESAIALLGGAPKDSTIYCVDTWEGTPSDRTGRIAKEVDVWKFFEQNAGELLGNTIRPVIGKSEDVASTFIDPQELDLLFIDGDHTREGVLTDINSWFRHVATHGLICGHDFCEAFPEVIEAVTEWVGQFGLKPNVLPGTSIWFVTKASIEHRQAVMNAARIPIVEHPANVPTKA